MHCCFDTRTLPARQVLTSSWLLTLESACVQSDLQNCTKGLRGKPTPSQPCPPCPSIEARMLSVTFLCLFPDFPHFGDEEAEAQSN